MYIVVSKKGGLIVGANSNREWAPGPVADEGQVAQIIDALRGEATETFVDALRDGAYEPPVVYTRKNARQVAKDINSHPGSVFDWAVFQVTTPQAKNKPKPDGWQVQVFTDAGGGEWVTSAFSYYPCSKTCNEGKVDWVEGYPGVVTTRAGARVLLDEARSANNLMEYRVAPYFMDKETN